FEIVRDPAADAFVRSRMCEAVAMVALRGEMPREEAALFLRACFLDFQTQEDACVWHGWQGAIALLGLEELKPLVKEAFARKFIDPTWLAFEDFEADLRHGMQHPGAPPLVGPEDEFDLFSDTIEEFSTWNFDEEKEPEAKPQREWTAPGLITPF